MNDKGSVSNAFMAFAREAPEYHQVWMETVRNLDRASKLDDKTQELAYLAVLAALRLESGIPFHVKQAKILGATRDEIISAVLVGMPAAGNMVVQTLPIAIDTYDNV